VAAEAVLFFLSGQAIAGGAGLVTIEDAAHVWTLRGTWEQVEKVEPVTLTLYSQRDPRWGSYEYAPGRTLATHGCFITSVAIVASLAGYPDTPQDVARKLNAAGALVGAYLSRPDRIPNAYPELAWVGSLDWRRVPANLVRLRQELEHGPVIVEVDAHPGGAQPPEDQHFVVALRFSDDGKDLVVADPWDGTETKLLQRYALDNWSLSRAIFGARLLRVRDD